MDLEKILVCDLDGTLAPSKAPLEKPMAEVICRVLRSRKMAVISGASFEQFEHQFLSYLPASAAELSNLHLFPINGSAYFNYDGSVWRQVYMETLTEIEKKRIYDAFGMALPASAADVHDVGGRVDILEDRGGQITFSGLGQEAPLPQKQAWDPDESKRMRIVELLKKEIPDFEIRIGGATSIDVTRKGITKAYAIRKIEEHLKVSKENIVFIGDALFPGGNDSAAKETGVTCIAVAGPQETLKILEQSLL